MGEWVCGCGLGYVHVPVGLFHSKSSHLLPCQFLFICYDTRQAIKITHKNREKNNEKKNKDKKVNNKSFNSNIFLETKIHTSH